jgi:hypothetical protein
MPKLVARPSKQQRYALANFYPAAAPSSSIILPAQRKVSEESIHSNSETADDRTCVRLSNNNSRKMTRTSSSLSSLLSSLTPSTTEPSSGLSSSSSSSALKRTNASSFRLKRPAPSACLVELASEDDDNAVTTHARRLRGVSSACCASPVAAADFADTLTSPPPLRTDSAEGWGFFVDTMFTDHVDDDTQCSSGSSTTSPYLPFHVSQPLKRRRIHSQAPRELAGFFLAVPTVDDTVCQLSSLSF